MADTRTITWLLVNHRSVPVNFEEDAGDKVAGEYGNLMKGCLQSFGVI